MTNTGKVLVAGGGLAGITAACDLADAGWRVTLLEKRPFLGGRAYSYTDQATGAEVDNGQHVFLGCCDQYIGLLKRLGVYDRVHLQKRLRVPVIDKVWGESILAADDLPPPLHLMRSLLRFKSLSPKEKALAAVALSALRILDRSKHPELDDVTFADWLRERRQSENAIRSLWNLIILPTLNDDITLVSADLAAMVFQEGFLRSRNGANVGWAKVGLTKLIGAAARSYLEARGGEVIVDRAIEGLLVEDGGVTVVSQAESVPIDACILALPTEATLSVLPAAVVEEPFFARARDIGSAPIVNVHLWYDRTVWGRRFAAFLNTPVQWVFNKSRLYGLDGPGQHLDISLSGARDWIDVPNVELVDMFVKEVESLIPEARGADVTRAIVVKQRDATFAAHPGVGRMRPGQRTPVPGHLPRRRLDQHGLAGDDGECRQERANGGSGAFGGCSERPCGYGDACGLLYAVKMRYYARPRGGKRDSQVRGGAANHMPTSQRLVCSSHVRVLPSSNIRINQPLPVTTPPRPTAKGAHGVRVEGGGPHEVPL